MEMLKRKTNNKQNRLNLQGCLYIVYENQLKTTQEKWRYKVL